MAMQSALAQMLMAPPAGGAPPAPPGSLAMPPPGPPPPGATLGVGAPPTLPGLPPAPTGIGAMPTGSTSSNPKQAADVAISALRDAKGYFGNLGDQIEQLISQLQGAASQANAGPGTQVGQPSGPGAALPPVSPTMDSGTKGAM